MTGRRGRAGRLYGIGVGPGDPDLMTIKAVRILSSVSVVAYPAPDSGESSARKIAAVHLPEKLREIEIRVPMRTGRFPVQPYERGAEAIAAELRGGHDVAVLCEGDPLFYGSFMYLHDRLASRFETIVVPGVTSLTACAAAAKLPLVGRNDDLRVLPATLDDVELEAHLARAQAVALIKVGRHLGRMRSLVDRLGQLKRAVFVAYASRPDEIVCPLADMSGEAAPYFSMILIPSARSADAKSFGGGFGINGERTAR